jgi:hypothetical protein
MENRYHFEFDYKAVKWQAMDDHEKRIHQIKRPIVMVLLTGQNDVRLAEPFLLDSGADNSFIKYDLARLLGLSLSQKTVKVKTAGADIDVFTTCLEMGMVQGNGYCEIGKKSFIYVFPPEKLDVPNIIGRTPLFDKFRITFRQYDGKVSLSFMEKIMSRKINRRN